MSRRWSWLTAGLLLAGISTTLGQVRATRAGAAAEAAAPANLSAVSTVPTQIVLTWPAVAGAEGYRVTRAPKEGQAETTIYEARVEAFALEPGMCRGSMPCWYPNYNVNLQHRYAYRVYAVFPGPVYSAPSPMATARSAPFAAPSNLTHAVVPSTVVPGLLQVTVSWLAVTGAQEYYVVPTTAGITATTVPTASVRFDPLRPKTTYGLCVSAVYAANIRDDSVRSCITLVL